LVVIATCNYSFHCTSSIKPIITCGEALEQNSVQHFVQEKTMEGEQSISGADSQSVHDAIENAENCNVDNNAAAAADPILEGMLFKKSSYDFWLPRYFVLSPDHRLSYYHKKDETSGRPRRTFLVTREAGCEVSNLYVSQRQTSSGEKELLYCFKLSWQNETSDESDDAFSAVFQDDNDSSIATGGHIRKQNSLDDDVEYLCEGDDGKQQHSPRVVSSTPSGDSMHNRYDDVSQYDNRSLESDSYLVANNNDSNHSRLKNHSSLSSINFSTKKKKKHRKFASKAIKSMQWTRSSSIGSSKKKGNITDHVISEELFPPTEEEGEDDDGGSLKNGSDLMDASFTRADRVQRMYAEQKKEERDKLRQQYMTQRKARKRKQERMLVKGTAVAVGASAAAGVAVLTAGAGLVAGLAVVGIGAAAGAGSSASSVLGFHNRGKRSEIVIATASYEKAKEWKETIDARLEYENLKETTWGRILFSEGQSNNAFLAQHPSSDRGFVDDQRIKEKPFLFEPSTQWRPLDGLTASMLGTGNQGLRIFREERRGSVCFSQNRPVKQFLTTLSIDNDEGGMCPPMKSQVVLNTSPLDAFMCIMSYARMAHKSADQVYSPLSELSSSFRVLGSINDHMDIIHLVFRPLYLFPSWTCPRDFVLIRYWRYEPDGSYVICYESVQHRDCPPSAEYVRGEMHQAYTVSPRTQLRTQKGGVRPEAAQECLLTAVVQVDPRGWVPSTPIPYVSCSCYRTAFGVAALTQLMDIRDAIDRDRFVAAALDIEPPTAHFHAKTYDGESDVLVLQPLEAQGVKAGHNYDFTYSATESTKIQASTSGLLSTPPPFYPDKWAEPDSNSFLVRGPSYKIDGMKINAGQSIGRLLAVEFLEVDAPIYSGMSKHPTERIQLALQKENILKQQGIKSDVPPFIFVLNIVLPNEPFYHMVFYYAVDDISEIDGSSGTPTSKLSKEFFFGDSDEFREKTFKLIPQIVQGNFMVRRAVGSTPVIMGKKLRQLYVKDEENKRFFEIILDCCSSSVAGGVIRLSLGYAKTLVIDMGFVLEGDDETVLPERIFGCVRIKNPDFSVPIRKVEPPKS